MLAINKLEYIETHIAFLSCFNLVLYFEQFPISKTIFQKHNFAIAEYSGQSISRSWIFQDKAVRFRFQ